MGDVAAAVYGRHGNRAVRPNQLVDSDRFQRTALSVVTTIARKTESGRIPINIYREEIATCKLSATKQANIGIGERGARWAGGAGG